MLLFMLPMSTKLFYDYCACISLLRSCFSSQFLYSASCVDLTVLCVDYQDFRGSILIMLILILSGHEQLRHCSAGACNRETFALLRSECRQMAGTGNVKSIFLRSYWFVISAKKKSQRANLAFVSKWMLKVEKQWMYLNRIMSFGLLLLGI